MALAAGATYTDAGQRAGVSERTVARRMEDTAFRAEVADCRRLMVERAIGQLADASTAAVATLRALLDAESDTARLGAARSILELGTKLRESVEMEARLIELEQQIGAVSGATKGRPR
ncbi:MAG: hypothetical protein AVDCRST_MAG77-4946 [uncultured Chloroflexi bacterium]|uniref:Uncharacterized protein n=1 Tax=uncultured Chloroflexota bacterium TaxID=166587 RepID=A0A6J4K1A4_9CHLR|nr:MAG: hypothetical protein AVDCRST_MAG77-4946 [uncultured Chloroflexota bacterium]